MSTDRWKVIALALALDLALGEPPERAHPVVWMGRLVGRIECAAPRTGSARQLAFGALATSGCLAAAALAARLLESGLGSRRIIALAATAFALKPAFAVKALFQMVRGVEDALSSGDLPAARRAVGRVVSRDVSNLDEELVSAAAVESLAENCSDSVVAPLFYYAAFGLPGAHCYRMANTLDAMLGYRGKYEYLGKVAARLDDLLNLIPSRLTALAIAAAAPVAGGSPATTWRAALRDSSRTASPNAGWPMAAAAGALGLRLEKSGHYVLNPGGRPAAAGDIRRARRLLGASLALAVLGIALMGRIRCDR